MKRALALLGLLGLGGCGSFINLTTGPQVYGGVRQDLRPIGSSCLHCRLLCDIPFSAVADTGLLPLTLMFEGLRAATGGSPPGVRN